MNWSKIGTRVGFPLFIVALLVVAIIFRAPWKQCLPRMPRWRALSVLGILIGSVFNFWIGRVLGRPFVASVTPAGMRFGPFVAFSTVGRLPGIVGSAVIGATAAQQGLIPAALLLGLAAILLVVGVNRQRQLERILTCWITRRRRRSAPSDGSDS